MVNLDLSEKNKLRFFITAAVFMCLYALALTLSPAVRARSWNVELRWEHWLGYLVWLVGFAIVHHQSERYLPRRDPLLLPVVALLTGWGLLTVWRLTPTFGLRQTIWLAISLTVVTLALRLPSDLRFLRKYKYLWLTSGLLLTALTLIFGTNPLGYGPRLWLGCCGIYLQPSEPLKLLLIIFLAAYLADWSGLLNSQRGGRDVIEKIASSRKRKFPFSLSRISLHNLPQFQILVPTLVMTGLAILILLVQRDLGTASILIFLYSVMVFLATGWWWVLVASFTTIAAAGFLGYLVFDVIRLRVDAWINPWLDPAGRSYQIVQSLMAIANGGIIGRGPGLGNPSLVPVAHSDFIFAAIAEEGGFIGVLGMLALLGLLVYLGLKTAIASADTFRRFLAGGITAFIVAQSVLIIGGNLRMLPLTGVTLPFVSYGGSSLLVSFMVVTLLLHISAKPEIDFRMEEITGGSSLSPNRFSPFLHVSRFLTLGLYAASLVTGWWIFVRNTDLLSRTDNPRRSIADRFVERGSILDRRGNPIVETIGTVGNYQRLVRYSSLGPIIGYNHPIYGQSGLEATLDPILRGIEGNDPSEIWWHYLVYGQPPPGLDVRLTLDLELQSVADSKLTDQVGGLILLNAENGEIMIMSSHPVYDPNQLDEKWEELIQDPQSPLLNRVIQGIYPTGDLSSILPLDSYENEAMATTTLRLPLVNTDFPEESTILEIALAASALSNSGIRPAPSITQLARNPEGAWLLLTPLGSAVEILEPGEVDKLVQSLSNPESFTWQIIHTPEGEDLTWFIGGTTSRWNGLPLTLALVLEKKNNDLAGEIGQAVLVEAMSQ